MNPVQTVQHWLYYREFGEQYNQTAVPANDRERLVAKLRRFENALFDGLVQIADRADQPGRLDNPPQSLRQILQQRLDQAPPIVIKPVRTQAQVTRQAILRGLAAAVIFLLILGTIFLLKTVR